MDTQTANAHCLSGFVSQFGDAVVPRRLLELGGGSISPEQVVSLLREQGQCARKVRVTRRVLLQLETPTLLVLRSGEVCVLESVRRGKATLRDGKGGRCLCPLAVVASEAVVAIDRGATLSPQRSLLKHLIALAIHNSRSIGYLLLINIASSGVGLIGAWLTRLALAQVLPAQDDSLLLAVVAGLAECACLSAWLGWIGARTRIAFDVQLVRAAGVAILQRTLALPYAEHEKRGLGRELQTVASAEVATRAAASALTTSLSDAIVASVYLLAIAINAPGLGIALLAVALLESVGTLLLAQKAARVQARELDQAARTRARLHELVEGVATLKAGHAEEQALVRWTERLTAERSLGLSRELTEVWLTVWGDAIQRFGAIGVLAWSALAVLAGELAVADLVYLSTLTVGFLQSSTSLGRQVSSIWSAAPHLERVDEMLRINSRPAARVAAPPIIANAGPAIELNEVWFRYGPDQPWILKNYNLKVERNDHIKLRGKTGTGKTTVLRLMAGLYRPERGTVSVFGRDPWQHQRAVTYLPQQAHLFPGSLRRNLEQLSGANIAQIVAACRKTGLAEWLKSLPMGLETLLAPGGGNISGGQRQWAVLTAAVASDRPIVLLDEAMSHIDYAVRRTLSEAALFEGKTSVSVSHDS